MSRYWDADSDRDWLLEEEPNDDEKTEAEAQDEPRRIPESMRRYWNGETFREF